MHLFFFFSIAYRICRLVLKLRGKLKRNRQRSIYRVISSFLPATTSEDYRSYDADKNYWRKCQIYQK